MIKCILGLMRPDAGSIEIDGEEVVGMPAAERERVMKKFGMLFQGRRLVRQSAGLGERSLPA